jgi:hypothetical protein
VTNRPAIHARSNLDDELSLRIGTNCPDKGFGSSVSCYLGHGTARVVVDKLSFARSGKDFAWMAQRQF